MISWDGPSELDRVDAQREDVAWVSRQWRDGARVLQVDGDARYATSDDGNRLRLVPASGDYDDQRHVLLGLVDSTPCFSVDAKVTGPVRALRENGQLLSPVERDVAAAATALTNWHRRSRFCSACGQATEVHQGGVMRLCPACGTQHFPRTDPAVIVAVVDQTDRLLLGRQPVWPPRRVSVLAGFVAAGESFEQTVHREVGEEVGVELGQLAYVASQPWPFPRSVMVGFAARATSNAICVDGTEIEWADWFDRGRLRDQVEAGELVLPMASSIAMRLIETWLAGDLPV